MQAQRRAARRKRKRARRHKRALERALAEAEREGTPIEEARAKAKSLADAEDAAEEAAERSRAAGSPTKRTSFSGRFEEITLECTQWCTADHKEWIVPHGGALSVRIRYERRCPVLADCLPHDAFRTLVDALKRMASQARELLLRELIDDVWLSRDQPVTVLRNT